MGTRIGGVVGYELLPRTVAEFDITRGRVARGYSPSLLLPPRADRRRRPRARFRAEQSRSLEETSEIHPNLPEPVLDFGYSVSLLRPYTLVGLGHQLVTHKRSSGSAVAVVQPARRGPRQ
jgi:hypothetical protein